MKPWAKRVWAACFCAFLAITVFCTFYSQTYHAKGLPHVTLGLAEVKSMTLLYRGLSTVQGSGADLYAEFVIPPELPPFFLGDRVDLRVPSIRNKNLKGEVAAVARGDAGATVRISISDADLSGGEDIELLEERQSDPIVQVPDAALYRDTRAYVYTVRKEAGAWGPVFVLRREDVPVFASQGGMTGLDRTMNFEAPIVVDRVEGLYDGAEVRLYP